MAKAPVRWAIRLNPDAELAEATGLEDATDTRACVSIRRWDDPVTGELREEITRTGDGCLDGTCAV